MRVSTRGRYGLRMAVDLASRYGRSPTLVDGISERIGVPATYLHTLATGLKAAGLFRSVRGRGGGYELVRPPSGVTALEVVTALEGRYVPVDCVADPSICPRSSACAARDLWCDVATAVDRVLAAVTLERLAQNQAAMAKRPAGQGKRLERRGRRRSRASAHG